MTAPHLAHRQSSIEAVLPLTQRDLDRAFMLIRSLDRYFPSLRRIWVVVPDNDFRVIRDSLRDHPRCEVVCESEFVPEIALWARLHPYLPRVFKKFGGWYLQQLIKLAAADHLESEFFITLDADVLCVKPTTVDNLIVDRKARSSRFASTDHADWYSDAAKVLKLPRSPWVHSVTPAVLSKAGVEALTHHLTGLAERRYGWWVAFLPGKLRTKLAPWRLYLLFNLPWTEYATYFTFLEAAGLYEQFHLPVDERSVSGIHRSVWSDADFASWEPAASFGNDEDYSFVVVQSNSRIPTIEVWEKVRPFLL